jgi:hypothetical protein
MCAPSQSSVILRHLFSGYPERELNRRLLLMLQAYVDDSGSSHDRNQENLGHFILAGYAMQASKWINFSEQWDRELTRSPKIDYFKMNEAEHGEKCFQGLDRPLRECKVNDLAAIIKAFDPLPIACYLKWIDYEEIVRGRVPPAMDNPYGVLFYQIMRGLHEFQIQVNKLFSFAYEQTDFFFDEQGSIGLDALKWYSDLKKRLPEPYSTMMGDTPIFRNEKKVVALQSADLFAWHVRRRMQFPEEKRKVWSAIAENGAWENHISRESLIRFVETTKLIDPTTLI